MEANPTVTPETQAVQPRQLDANAYSRMLARQEGEDVPRETPEPPTTTPEAQLSAVVEDNWLVGDVAPEVVTTPADTTTPAPLLEAITEVLGLNELPEDATARTEAIVNALRGIRSATETDEYRSLQQQIDIANNHLALGDDELVYIDKLSRLKDDFTPEQIDAQVEAMSDDDKARVANQIRDKYKSQITSNSDAQKQIEANKVQAEAAAKLKQENDLKAGNEAFAKALSEYEVIPGQKLSPKATEFIRDYTMNQLFKVLTSDGAATIRAVVELVPELRAMRDKIRFQTVAQQAVSDQLKKQDGQQLNIGNGSFQTTPVRSVNGSEYGRMQSQQHVNN